jgi:CBS domain-containing protein
MNVEQCMSKSPRVCTPADTLSNVARILWEHDLGALPVVDQQGSVVGMITDRDVCMAAYTCGLALHASTVGRHMSRTVFSIGAKADASKAAELMRTRRVRRLPVVENGRLVGLVTLTDLARHAGRNGKSRALEAAEVARVLASICEPRVATEAATEAAAEPAATPVLRKVKSVLRPKPRALAKRR